MAISRMQQPRQNYGLGSFVKKLTRKVTRPFTKVARKLVPKEIAGIMRVAAPFVPGPAGTLMYLAGTAKQRGGISPVDLALAAAPYAAQTNFGKGITEKIGNINVPFTTNEFEPNRAKTLREFLVGDTSKYKTKITPGLFGEGDRMFKIGSGMSPLDTKAGQFLFGTPLKDNKGNIIPGKFKPSYTKIGAQALAVGDFINTQKQLEKLNEGASDVVEETAGGGVTDSEAYQNFLERLALLTPEAFRVPEGLRLPAKSGGLMRTNFSIGGRDEDPKPLPSDPTEPVNPFRPKPIGPFPSKKASVDDPFYRDSEGDRDEHSFRMFNKPYKELNQNELEEFIEEMMRLMNKLSKGPVIPSDEDPISPFAPKPT